MSYDILTNEQRRIVTQIGNHVSVALANRVNEFFMCGGKPDDLLDLLVTASNDLQEKPKAAAR